MKPIGKMDMKTRRILRRALALVLAFVLVAGVGLSYSSDRLLRAEEITAEDMQQENVVTETKTVETPAPAPAQEEKKEEPAPVEVSLDADEGSGGETGGDSGAAQAAEENGGEAQAQPADEELVIESKPAEETEEPAEEFWVVSFYDRDAELYKKVEVEKGKAIGDKIPPAIPREDYKAYWAVGKIVQGGQGNEIKVTGNRITGNFTPSEDTVIVPDYDKVTLTVTFYDREGGNVIEGGVKKVTADTNYCLNDIPQPPARDGYAGRWVYSGGAFSNSVQVTQDMNVWAVYDQNVFTVTFKVGDETYRTDTYFSGDKLDIPSEPAAEGRTFAGWFSGDTEYKGGENVTSDLILTAAFTDQYRVVFVIDDGEGNTERLSQYFRTDGQKIGTMPQDPFVAGKVFDKWVNQDTGEEVTAATIVNGNITAVASFRDVGVYSVTSEYYYVNDSGKEVTFSTDLIQVESSQLPYTLTAPASIQTDPSQVSGSPVYFPETPSVTLDQNDFDGNRHAAVRIKYVKRTATYDVVYKLKNLNDDGYTEIERVKGVQGVLNSYVTPPVKVYDYYTLELAESTKITKASGQEVPVLYERKNVQLTFETNGGSYVAGVTAPYGSKENLPAANPEREGYTFAGWYADPELSQKVTGSVTLNGDTTLYAKWTGRSVNYTIVYMCEKYNDNGTSSSFVYDNSRTDDAIVGSTVYATSAPAYSKAHYEADNAQNAASSVIIAADGSSVLKVYYKLKSYKVDFNLNNNSNSTTMKKDGTTYRGNSSTRYSISVKLGQSLDGLWPTTDNATFSRSGYSFVGWRTASSSGTTYVTKQTFVTSDLLPTSGTSKTYYANWQSKTTTYTINYYLQNADNNDYTLSSEYSQTLNAQSNASFSAKTIKGYTNVESKNTQQGNTYNFYYNRDTYKVDYFFGGNLLKTNSNVKFDAHISTLNWTPSAAQCDVDNDYTFAGWYNNPSCQGDPYSFDRMPASNLALYAKWTAPTYTVSFVDADDATLQPAKSQTVEKYKKAEKPANPAKSGYAFDGWYADADGNTLFDWNTQITKDTTVYACWVRKNLKYIVRYVDEEGNALASDKEVSNPNLVTGQTVTELPVAVAGYRPAESSKTLVLADENNVIEFVYSAKSDVTSYKVRYLIDPEEGYGSEVAVADEKIVNDVPGETSSVIETAAAVDYGKLYAAVPALDGIEFHPDAAQKTLVLSADSAGSVLTFYYSGFKHADVTVHYVDMAGSKIAADHMEKLKVGKTFTLNRAVNEGWDLYKAVSGNAITGDGAGSDYKITEETTANGLEFTLFYQKKATITALSASKQYDGKVLKLPEEQVRVEGLKDGHTLGSIDFTYENADADSGDGRLAAGIATVTPKDAVIAGAPSDDYYSIRYISGTLEVSKINVTIRIEPDRWTGAAYTGEEYRAGFTNPNKKVADYVIISHAGYSEAYLDKVWDAITAKATYDENGKGLKYYCISEKNAGDYPYGIDVTLADLPEDDNYSVGLFVRPGRLHILPKDASVSTGSASKGYDGTALTQEDASITGLVADDEGKVSAKGTGSQTEPGSSKNTYSIDWGTVAAGNYNIVSEQLGTLTVTPGAVVLTAASGSKTYDGKALTNAAVTASGLPEGFKAEASATGSQTDAGSSANVVDEAYVIRNAEGKDVTDMFTVSERINGTLTVNRAPLNITTGSASKPYDGKPLTNGEAKIEGLVNGETAAVAATGSQTDPGSSSNTYSIDWGNTNAANYYITETPGTLTVTENSAEVTLTAPSASKTYDGAPLTADGTGDAKVTASGLPAGFTVEATASGSRTDAGTSDNVINKGYVIRNAVGEDKTSNFKNIALINGTLTVNKAPVTVTTGSASKAYDGYALTNNEAAITGLVNDETAEVTATGSQTEIGVGQNTANINWGTAKPDNYQVTQNLGTLTVTANNNAVTLTAPSDSKVYDGTALTANGSGEKKVTADGLPEGFTVEATATGSQTDAGSSPNVVNDQYVIRNADGQDRTANFTNVIKAEGTLTVSKAAVTVTTGSANKAYDGTALTNGDASIEGLVNGETATVTATGSQIEPGSGDNTYSIEWGSTKAGNYSVSEVLGTLLVTENDAEITITAPSDSKVYDGTALTADGTGEKKIAVSGLPEGFVVDAVATGTQTDAGTSVNAIGEGYAIRNSAGADKTACFTDVKTVNGELTVTPKEVKVTTGSAAKQYDGTALTNAEATIEGLVTGETATAVASGTITEPGTEPNTYDITWGSVNADNYTITEALGSLTVTENSAKITLTAPSDSKIYDGTALTADGSGDKKVIASGLPEGFTVEATASGEQTDAGDSKNTVNDGYVIRNAAGEDKTSLFTNVTKADGTLTVTPKAVTISTGSASKPYDGDPLTSDVVSIEGLAGEETVGLEATGSIREKGSKPNSYRITWAANGNEFSAKKANYTVTENLGTLTITDSDVEVTLTAPSAHKTYDGQALTADGTDENNKVIAAGLPKGFTVEATASGSQTDAGSSANVVNDGYVIKNAAGEDKTSNFKNVMKVDGTLTVNPKSVTITTGDASKVYDGTALTNAEARIEGLAAGETYKLEATGSVIEVGSEPNSYSMTWAGKDNAYTAKADNYTVAENIGTLTVTTSGAVITLTAESGEKVYDGSELTNPKVNVTGLPAGFTAEATAKGGQKDAGASANVVKDNYVIKNAAGENKTSNFTNIKKVDGLLTVTKAPLTITTGSGKKAYDGTALTSSEASVEGLVGNDRAKVTATGTQTDVGTSSNTYSIDWGIFGLFTNENNYQIEEKLGTLEVTVNNDEIVLTAPSAEKAYDGTPLNADGEVTASGLPNGFTVAATASGSQTDAGSSASTVNEGYAILDSGSVNRTAFFTNVKTADGTLTVSKRKVTLTSADDEKVYDGTALINNSVVTGGDGFASGEGASFNVTGSQKDAGSSANVFTYILDSGTKADNYDVTTAEGKLTVTAINDKVTVTVTERSGSEKYDGSIKTVKGYDAVSDNALYMTGDFGFSGNDSVSGTAAGSYDMELKPEDFTNTSKNFTNVAFVINDGILQIGKRSLSINSASGEKVYDGIPLTKHEISVTGDGFADGEGAMYSFTGSQTVPGASRNEFAYTLAQGVSADNYIITTALGMLTVTSRPDDAKFEVTVQAASGKALYDGSEHSVNGFVDGISGEIVTGNIGVKAGGHKYTVSGLEASASATDVGSYTVGVTGKAVVKDENGNDVTSEFIVKPVPGSLEISKRSVIMTSGSATQKYNGKPLTNSNVEVTGNGFASGEGASYNVTGSQTIPGMSPNTFSYTLNEGTSENNYNIETVEGQLTVTSRDARYSIVLRPSGMETMYDGAEKTVSGFESLSFTVDGSVYTVEGVSAERTATHAGTYPVNVTGNAVVRDAAGNDVTSQFEVTSMAAYLSIGKRSVTLTSADAEKAYDGSALTATEVTVSGDGFADGEGASYTVSGSRILPGASLNTFTYALNEGTAAGDYDIDTVFGILTVTNRPDDAKYEVKVKAASGSAKYDGSEHSVSGLIDGISSKTVTESIEVMVNGHKYTVSGLSASASATNAGSYKVGITGTPVVTDEGGNDVSSEFMVKPIPGSLEISKRSVIMTSGSATHAYNGKPLTNSDMTVTGDGFADGEGAAYVFTGTKTLVGVADNTFEYTLNDGTLAGNYDISKVYGKLNVTNRDAKYVLTMSPNFAIEMYDGEEHSVSGFISTRAVVEGETYEISGLTAGAAGTDAGTYDVSVTGTAVVKDKDGNDVTDQFSVVSENATLTITPRSVLLRSADESAEYDGKAHTGSGKITVEGDGFAGNDGVVITPTASRTLVGATPNTFDWAFSTGTKAGNYKVETAYGLLSIVNREAQYEINMKANSDTVEYDGEEHSVSGFEKNEFEVEGSKYTVDNVEAEARGTEAGVYATDINGTAKVSDAGGNDVTEQFAVSYESGSLTITAVESGETPTGDSGNPGSGPDGSGGSGAGSGTTGSGLDIDTIIENGVPVAAAPSGYWAILNLIMMIANVLGGLYMIFRRYRDEDDDSDDYEGQDAAADDTEQNRRRKRGLSVIVTVALAIIAPVVFFITEDLTNTPALFDKYTLLMAVMLIAAIVFIINGKKDSDEKTEEESAY